MNIKRPNAFIYFLAYILIYPLLKIFYNLKIDRKGFKMPKGSYIVLSNHLTMYDFLLVMLSFYPRRLNAVTAQKFFMYKPLNKFLPALGCISKNMFDPDVRSVISIKTVLKRGGGVLLFAEGRCSGTHAYVGIHKATGKLLKKFGVPVVSAYLEGVTNCMPHWRKGTRFGRVRITYRNLFAADDLKQKSVDEINAEIDERLGSSVCTTPPKKPFETYRAKRLAEGLEQMLYFCPKCEREFVMTSEGNILRCYACGFEAELTRQGKLVHGENSELTDDISVWVQNQVRFAMKAISADMEPIIETVKVRTPSPVSGDGMIESGYGTVMLSPKGWFFEGIISDEPTSLFFPIDTLPAISYDHCNNFQLYHEGNFYMFVPKDPRMCLKYVILTEGMHWRFAKNPLLTPGVNSGYL